MMWCLLPFYTVICIRNNKHEYTIPTTVKVPVDLCGNVLHFHGEMLITFFAPVKSVDKLHPKKFTIPLFR